MSESLVVKNFPDGQWRINVDGVKYTGEIAEVDPMPDNCGVAIWTMRTYGKKSDHVQLDISAPRTAFRKEKSI